MIRFATLLLALCFPALAAANPDSQQNLIGPWKFSAGDDPARALISYDDSKWQTQWVPDSWHADGYPESNHFGWYRRTVDVSGLTKEDLGIRVGTVRNAYELYVNGQKISTVGAFPPQPSTNYDRIKVVRIPQRLILDDGEVLIALRVWGGSDLSIRTTGAGPYAGKFLIGNYTKLLRSLDAEQIPMLIFASLFLLAGAYFLYLHVKTHAVPAFLWFGVTAVTLALYIVTQSQWKYVLDFSFLTFEKIEAISFFVFLAFMTQLIWSVMEHAVPKVMRIIQSLYLILAIVYMFAPSLDIHYQLRPFWQLLAASSLGPILWIIAKQMRKGNPDARLLFYGFIIFSLCALNDLLINLNLHLDSGIRVMPIGFLAILIAMGASLAGKFNIMLTSLEQQVDARTQELSLVNEQLAQANNSLVEMARIDPLTGSLNRRGLEAEAEIERQRFIRQREPLALIIADIDNFKAFNDQFGHACGDAVLVAVAEQFKEHIRDVDRVSRWGGEEFVLLFPGTDEQGLSNISEKLRELIEQFKLDYDGRVLNVTMTFGGAIYQASESIDECLARADKALYKGKVDGRNRVVIAAS